MLKKSDLILGDGYTVQYIGDALQHCTIKTYVILLTIVNSIKLILKIQQQQQS